MEGEVADAVFIGRLARSDAPSCRLGDRVGDVGERAEATGWNQAVVVDERGVLLGWLSQDALRSEPAAEVSAVMLEGPVTFRPNMRPEETGSWMDGRSVDSVLVTSSDGTFMGVLRREDL